MKVALSYPPNAESVSGCSILPLAGRAMTKTHRNRERAGCLTSFGWRRLTRVVTDLPSGWIGCSVPG